MLTEREYKTLFLNETQHFPEFLVPIFKSAAQYLDAIIVAMIKSNVEKYKAPYYLTENKYLNSIIFDIELFKSDNITDLSQYLAEYFGNYIDKIEKRFQYIVLKIKCPYNGKDFGYPFLNSIVYHELEHMFDDYICQINGGTAMIDNIQCYQINDFSKYISENYSENKFLKAINDILYLGQIIEIKAFSTQAYAELEKSECTRENYKQVLDNITAYRQYKAAKEKDLPIIKTASETDIKQLGKLSSKFPKIIIPKKQAQESFSQYREKIYKWTEQRIHIFIKRFGGILSLYLQNNIKGIK